MNRIQETLRRITADLDACGVSWALVGGLAVSARTEPRFTRDIDLSVLVSSDRAAEELVRTLLSGGYRMEAIVEQTATGRLATVRLIPPGGEPGGTVVDLLFASSGIEPEIVREAEPLEVLPEQSMPVATLAHLIALKVLARDDEKRPQDLLDLRMLLKAARPPELEAARTALKLIDERGFSRGKNLIAELELMLGKEHPG